MSSSSYGMSSPCKRKVEGEIVDSIPTRCVCVAHQSKKNKSKANYIKAHSIHASCSFCQSENIKSNA